MALKDWKKVRNNPYMIEFNNDEKIIAIYKANKTWFVSEGISWYGKGLKDVKSFKTKSQALKFAKSYMRTH